MRPIRLGLILPAILLFALVASAGVALADEGKTDTSAVIDGRVGPTNAASELHSNYATTSGMTGDFVTMVPRKTAGNYYDAGFSGSSKLVLTIPAGQTYHIKYFVSADSRFLDIGVSWKSSLHQGSYPAVTVYDPYHNWIGPVRPCDFQPCASSFLFHFERDGDGSMIGCWDIYISTDVTDEFTLEGISYD